MPSAKSLVSESKTDDVNCGWGITCRMTYDLRKIVMAQEAKNELADDEVEEVDTTKVARDICEMVSQWDMTGPVPIMDTNGVKAGSKVPDDEPIPLDPEIVKWLTMPLLQGISIGLVQSALPDPKVMQKQSQKRGTGGTITPLR